MRGTALQKVARLVGHLIAQPKYFIPYLRTNIIADTSPLELELPWISYGAIDFLKEFVRPDMSVFEYGSGGSTLFFARRAAAVTSTEDNRLWMDKVAQRLAQLGLNNALFQYHEFDFKQPANFKHSRYLHSIPDKKFDIIVVDGTEEAIDVRSICFQHAEKFVRNGGIIIVDDSWRYPDLRRTHQAKRCTVFQSVGPCRPGVTSTDIFFY